MGQVILPTATTTTTRSSLSQSKTSLMIEPGLDGNVQKTLLKT